MNCRDFRAMLRAGSPLELTGDARAHRAACPACDGEARAWTLLHLGSALAADEPRDGFEARLRARIASEKPAAAGATWADGIGLVARPALGAALLAMVAALAWSGWERTRPSADDFGVLAGGDGVINAVLADQVEDTDSASAAAGADSTGNAP